MQRDREAFIYNNTLWIREWYYFCKMSANRHEAVIKPHEYFEAYTAMKNEEGKKFVSGTV